MDKDTLIKTWPERLAMYKALLYYRDHAPDVDTAWYYDYLTKLAERVLEGNV